jgi:hypothetical protein
MFTNLSTTARADAFALMALHGYSEADVLWLIESAEPFGHTPENVLANTLSAWEYAQGFEFDQLVH